MTEGREINTDGGDYRETKNRGQYAEGDIYIYSPTPPESRDLAEANLLKAVKNEVAGRLAQSLHNRVYIELDKTEDPSQVVPPWSVDVKLGNAPSQHCPDGTNIVEIYDRREIGGRLLILGAPGSGKTTMLLQLADALVQRALADAAHPVPVLLNLSAWQQEFKDIPSWMMTDLKLKYGVRKDIAQKWIEKGRILPLLDGLDELMSARQETCVKALNAFLPEWSGLPLVVCSRREEYQIYEANLGLNGAVILQPLTDGQIEWFLRGAKCEWLWAVVRSDLDVMDGDEGLARSPLLLTILVLASDGLPVELWQREESVTERRRILFEAYIAGRLHRRYVGGVNLPATKQGMKPYQDDEKIKAWICWLALRLIEENQTEFFIEKLQPRLLATRWQNFVYGLVLVSISGPFLGLFVGLFLGVISGLSAGLFGMVVGLFVGLFGGVILGVFYGLFGGIGSIKTVETIKNPLRVSIRFFFNNLIRSLIFTLFFNLVVVLSLCLILVPFFGLVGLVFALFFGLFVGLLGGLAEALIGMLFMTLIGPEVDTKNKDNQGIYLSIFNSLIFGLMSVPLGIAISVAMHYFKVPLTLNELLLLGTASTFLLSVISGGLISAFQHFVLRITLWLFGYSPWNYSKFLRYCTDRGFLQRVGGGYRFVHALLRDHFAEQYDNCRGK
jgi:NACHT domain